MLDRVKRDQCGVSLQDSTDAFGRKESGFCEWSTGSRVLQSFCVVFVTNAEPTDLRSVALVQVPQFVLIGARLQSVIVRPCNLGVA